LPKVTGDYCTSLRTSPGLVVPAVDSVAAAMAAVMAMD